MKILLGDFNAKVGRENISNRHLGMRVYITIVMIMVLEYKLCQIKSLVVKSRMFPHRNIHRTPGPLLMGRLTTRLITY